MDKESIKYFNVNGVPVKFRMTKNGQPRFESWDTKKPQLFSALDVYKDGREITERDFTRLVDTFRRKTTKP